MGKVGTYGCKILATNFCKISSMNNPRAGNCFNVRFRRLRGARNRQKPPSGGSFLKGGQFGWNDVGGANQQQAPQASLSYDRGMSLARVRRSGFQHPTTEIPAPPSDHTPLRRRCALVAYFESASGLIRPVPGVWGSLPWPKFTCHQLEPFRFRRG